MGNETYLIKEVVDPISSGISRSKLLDTSNALSDLSLLTNKNDKLQLKKRREWFKSKDFKMPYYPIAAGRWQSFVMANIQLGQQR